MDRFEKLEILKLDLQRTGKSLETLLLHYLDKAEKKILETWWGETVTIPLNSKYMNIGITWCTDSFRKSWNACRRWMLSSSAAVWDKVAAHLLS